MIKKIAGAAAVFSCPLVVILMVGAVSFGETPSETVGEIVCPNAYSQAALDNVHWVIRAPNSACYASDCDEDVIQTYVRRATELKRWARSLNGFCERSAYVGWASYVEMNAGEARSRGKSNRLRQSLNLNVPPT